MIIAGSSDANEVRWAKTILPLRSTGNLLLCTLLLGNVMVNAALSILLSAFTDGTLQWRERASLAVLPPCLRIFLFLAHL